MEEIAAHALGATLAAGILAAIGWIWARLHEASKPVLWALGGTFLGVLMLEALLVSYNLGKQSVQERRARVEGSGIAAPRSPEKISGATQEGIATANGSHAIRTIEATGTSAPLMPQVKAPGSPQEAMTMVNKAPAFLRDAARKQFIGVSVSWTCALGEVTTRGEKTTLVLHCGEQDTKIIFAQVDPRLPGIRLLDEGDIVTVSGPIADFTSGYLEIDPARVVKVAGPTPSPK
ncbi:MAG TPA: hypothetical protein VN999_18830 [Thermoanaerobaculia bacterium]|nr:hypothetical protein [Thermoanaerobaculia bacterium]